MSGTDAIRDWWVASLLGQQASGHPVFGTALHVEVDGDLVTLTGEVKSSDQAEEIEREARRIDTVKTVVNRLTVTETSTLYHLQTVIGVFADADSARLACQATSYWKAHGAEEAALLDDEEAARRELLKRAKAAKIPAESIDSYISAVQSGKVLLVDRVPEDDALRIISELEGSRAETVRTLPPEPEALETVGRE